MKELFNFSKNDIIKHIEYELKTLNGFKKSIDYIIKNLQKSGNSLAVKNINKIPNLSKIKERKGKNYDWSCISYKDITLVIRKYNHHLTIFTKIKNNKPSLHKYDYGAFTMNSDTDKIDDGILDSYLNNAYDNPFSDLNDIILELLTLLSEKSVCNVWNSYSLRRPKHVDIKYVFENNDISNLELYVYCMEEVSNVYLEMFAETDMLKRLSYFICKTDEMLDDRYKIGKVINIVKGGYYHNVGMGLIDTMGGNKERFTDVYSLTRWYIKNMFDNIYQYDGEIYVEGGNIKEGSVVTYKGNNDHTIIYKSTMPIENFISLVKF